MKKLVLVLPELSPVATSQYAHFVPLVRHLARSVEVSVVVECGPAPELDGIGVIEQRQDLPPARAAELASILIRLRRQGYRHAYGAYSPYFGVVAGGLGRLIGLRTAYWHCREDFMNSRVSRPWRLRDVLMDTLPLVLSLHLCRVLVTGTGSLARNYSRRFRLTPSRIRVVPNAVDLSQVYRRPPCEPRVPPTLLFVGRLTEHKGADLLPRLLRSVTQSLPGARLVIVGDGPLRPWLAVDLATECRAGQAVLLGSRPNPEARLHMADADLLLLPSRSEGFPRVLLEAMAAGLPFAATAVGGIPEMVPPQAAAVLARPTDAAALSAVATSILGNRQLHRELAEAGSRWVGDYDVPVVAARLVDALA